MLKIGCVADDFTGAGDIASFIRAAGLKTALYNGVPAEEETLPSDIEAIVIALKSRTQETAQAVEDSLKGFRYLAAHRAETLYFKYCSTFDSTPNGNIGPVIDAVMEAFDLPYTLLCPSLPVNGRTVKDGILSVYGVPLAESHMRRHPLTPMWASDLRELMSAQGTYPCFLIRASLMEDWPACQAKIKQLVEQHRRFYLCPDYEDDADGEKIAARFGGLRFLTGGSGLGGALAQRIASGRSKPKWEKGRSNGHRLLLAGSCSEMTQKQVRNYLDLQGIGVPIDPYKLSNRTQTVDSIWAQAKELLHRGDVLLYTTGSGGAAPGSMEDANRLEQALSMVAVLAVADGLEKLIVAGGETSGAVTKALGYRLFTIGESAAPGVPVMNPVENPKLSLVLKSGNFGGEDFLFNVLREQEG